MRKVTFYTPSKTNKNCINTETLLPLEDIPGFDKKKGSNYSLQGRLDIEKFGLFLGIEGDYAGEPEVVKDDDNAYVLIFNKKK